MTARLALTLASLLLAIAVALGAFGARALRSRLAPDLQRALGAVTPIGGAAFIAGWLALAWAAWRAT